MTDIIHINWSGPISPDEAYKLTGSSDYGVYQFCGNHPQRGSNSLLYIGGSIGITFGAQMKQHSPEPSAGPSAYINVGRLCGEITPENTEWHRQIAAAASLLIHTHAPAWNSVEASELDPRETRILNWGNRGSLLPEVSTLRYVRDSDGPPDRALFDPYAIQGS
jgi:hypothetical protein